MAQRTDELTDHTEDLADLIHILILEPSDTLTSVDLQLVFSLIERPINAIESHPGWYELTWALSDDGFGVVLYVPNTDLKLLAILTKETRQWPSSRPTASMQSGQRYFECPVQHFEQRLGCATGAALALFPVAYRLQ